MKDHEITLNLTSAVNSLSDVNKLINELESIEEFFLKMKAKFGYD